MGVQVQELTQNLMPWGKEYIDFSFAGRHISEFGLVAVTSGDRYQFAGSPEFADETSTVNGVWGQYYWGTNFKTKTYSYSLATDGMTERQYEDFKRHFRPGHYGQFYEDTWFERYCYVRIKTVVDFTFIPFQEEVEVAGVKFPSRIYKGEAKISFIQDRPFMYSFYQVLDTKIADFATTHDNGRAAARMMYHSNIPARDSWTQQNIKCATGSWFSLPAVKKITKERVRTDANGNEVKNYYYDYEVDDDTTNVFNKVSSFPYYNPSTFGSESTIEFAINRTTTELNFLEWEPVYFDEIYDSITNAGQPYNTIGTTQSIPVNSAAHNRYTSVFKYSLPEVSSDINKAIDVAWRFYQENVRGALAELQENLQEELINTKVLLWAIKVLQKIQINQVMYMPEDYNASGTLDGMLIDYTRGLSEEEQGTIEETAESVIGQIIFHSGDYETVIYDEENGDVPGCLRPDKVTVDVSMLCERDTLSVDWFGYFNIMMLMMFAECDFNEDRDILTPGVFRSFYPYTLKFEGEKGQAFVSYKYNFMGGDGIIAQENILEENCSNIVASNYLMVDGGDTIDISTGKIASYHILGFNRGEDEAIVVDNVRLEYKYTYA